MNNITNGINSLNSENKIVKNVKKSSPNTKLVFSSLLRRKDKKDFSKNVTDINSRWENYCQQKRIDFIDNGNILEEHLENSVLLIIYKIYKVIVLNFR